MRASSRAIFAKMALVTITSFLLACGPSEDASSPSEGTSSSEVSLFEELLGTIPDTPDTRKSVTINDYAAVREIFEIPLPGLDAGESAFLEYFKALSGSDARMSEAPFISGLTSDAITNPRRQYFAFDGRNVDQSVTAGHPPAYLEVVWGRYDPDATANALASCSECPPPDIETHNGVPFYSWGPDFAGDIRNRDKPPAFDNLGRGGRIAVSNEYVYRTIETPGMKALIDARAGDGLSLADVEEFRLLADTMSGLGVYTTFFTDQTQRISLTDGTSMFSHLEGVHDKLKDEIRESTLLLPYQAFAAGAGADDAGPYMALALVHSDAESAEENGRRLRIRIAVTNDYPELEDWRGLLEGYTYQAEGRVLSLKIRGERMASAWMGLAFGMTPLIPHE